jgi:hypothetical protein
MQDTGNNISSVRNWFPVGIFGETLSPFEGIGGILHILQINKLLQGKLYAVKLS